MVTCRGRSILNHLQFQSSNGLRSAAITSQVIVCPHWPDSLTKAGCPYLARFSGDVVYHCTVPLTLNSSEALSGQHRWYPTSPEKRARYGAPGVGEGITRQMGLGIAGSQGSKARPGAPYCVKIAVDSRCTLLAGRADTYQADSVESSFAGVLRWRAPEGHYAGVLGLKMVV